jgi:hypothetical protein
MSRRVTCPLSRDSTCRAVIVMRRLVCEDVVRRRHNEGRDDEKWLSWVRADV